jgi:hypothetical protein
MNVTQYSTWVPLAAGVFIPLVVALLTKINATAWQKSLIALLCLSLTALGTYLMDTGQSHTWKGALTAFVLALFSAASSRLTVTGGLDTKLNVITGNFGVGSGGTYTDMGVPKAA